MHTKYLKECLLGWSDFHFFCEFRKSTHCYWLAIFLWVQCQKISEFCRVHSQRKRGKVFIFKKSQGPQKWICFWKVCKNLSFISKNKFQQENLKLNFVLYLIFFFSKLVKMVFDLNNWKQICLGIFSSFLLFNKIRNCGRWFCFRLNL